MEVANKNIVILGAARSGLAAGELAKNLGARVFVSDNAPEKVVEMERKKKEDAETKILKLEENMKNLKGSN